MAASKELNDFLKSLSKDDLEKEVNKLVTKFKPVKEYYASELRTDKGELLKHSKIRLTKLILKKGGNIKPDMAGANKLVREFSLVSANREDVIDLMLHKVELSTEFAKEWGYYYPAVETSAKKTYSDAWKLIRKNKLGGFFNKRCKEIEAKAEDDGVILER